MWKPLEANKLAEMIEEAELFMDSGCRKFWDYIKVNPQKWGLVDARQWNLSSLGHESIGFWVVALIGSTCIYYNDIECGFNFSSYKSFGEITDYHCDQLNLIETINGFYQRVLDETH